MRAYSSARRIKSLFCTQWPSSVMAMTPAALSEPMGASSSPAMFCVMAPATKTLILLSRCARSRISATVPGIVNGRRGIGHADHRGKPPRAAAAVPVAMVSLADWPGSRKWACKSIKPGQTTMPVASKRGVLAGACAARPGADRAIFPSRIKNIRHGIEAIGGIDHASAGHEQRIHRRRRIYGGGLTRQARAVR